MTGINTEILSQLLLIHSVVADLPDADMIFSFVCRGLENIPGVESVGYSNSNHPPPFDSDKSNPSIRSFNIIRSSTQYGELIFRLTDPDPFDPYVPYIQNLAVILGVILEENRQRIENATYRENLERMVQERTRKLTESEERFRQLAENIDDVFWMTSTDKKTMLYISPAFEKIWGLTCAALYENPLLWAEAIHPDDRARVVEHAHTLQESGDYDEEYRISRPDGSIRWIRDRAFPLKDKDGHTYRVVGIASDFTELKHVEMELQQKESFLSMIYDNTHAAIFVVDAYSDGNFRYVDWNGIIEAITGIKSAYARGRSPEELFGPIYGKTVSDNYKKCVENGSYTLDEPFDTGHGTTWWQTNLRLIKSASGSPDQILGTAANITEIKLAQEALRESELKLRTLFDASRDAIGVSLDGQHLFANPSYLNLFGIQDADGLKNLKVLDLIAEEERGRIAEFIARRSRGEEVPTLYETKGRRLNGETFDMEANVSTYELNGKAHTLAYLRDISDKKKAEAEKDALKEQLRQSQKMEAIGTLAGGIAHDFNNILGAVLGYAQLVHDRQEIGSENWEDLGEVLLAAKRAKELVSQILAFSRKAAEARAPIQMHLVVGEAVKLLRQAIPTTIEFKQDISKECDTVLADATQMHQVVMNLCTNSYQAMLEKGGTLSVSLRHAEVSSLRAQSLAGLSPGPHVVLTVKDTGVGMAPETLMRIFEPFFTTKPVGKGTGMGMAVVHGIVKNHGGAIDIQSALGQGTSVEVYLPCYSGEASLGQGDEGVFAGSGERILVVDDEPTLAKVTSKILTLSGYAVDYCTSSEEALERFRQDPDAYDLVITDQTMPEMTGLSLAKQMMACKPDLRVIICTGYSETLDEGQALGAGVRALLAKPLDRGRLTRAVREALDLPQASPKE